MVGALVGGGGSHGADIAAIAYRCGRAINFYDEDPKKGLSVPPWDLGGDLIIGSNYPAIRREIAERYGHMDGAKALVDPSAVIGPNVTLGRGVVIAPHATLLTGVTLEPHVHVNGGVFITRAYIGMYSTLSPNCTICGDVTIGTGTLVGAGAVVSDRCLVGSDVTIGAGAVVPPLSTVPDGTTVIGVWKK